MSKTSDLPKDILEAIFAVTGEGNTSLHEPSFQGKEWNYLKDCLDTTYVSSVGAYVDRFEADLAEYTGAKFAVAVSNGTAGLHIALILAGVQPGDEVLIPSLSFVATANAVAYCYATPHFMDSCADNLGIDIYALDQYLRAETEQINGCCVNKRSGKSIKAIVPMHVFGHPVDMDHLIEVAAQHNLVVVEDAAESLGSYYKNKHTGTLGQMGVLSFNGNKIITTGGGGAILTNDEALAKRAKHITTTAKISHKWEYRHDEVGYNYRLPNINAALGCAQLEQIETFIQAKRKLFKTYRDVFKNIPEIALLAEPIDCHSNYWLQTIILNDKYEFLLEDILQVTNDNGIMTRPLWTPLHQLKPYLNCPKMKVHNAERFATRVINIPSSSYLMDEAQ